MVVVKGEGSANLMVVEFEGDGRSLGWRDKHRQLLEGFASAINCTAKTNDWQVHLLSRPR